MANREIYSAVLASNLTDAVAATATVNSRNLDLQGYESGMIVANVGIEGITLSTTNKIGLQLQESDTTTDGDFTSVSAANTNNGESLIELTDNAQTPGVFVFSYRGTKRYIRLRWIYSGTHGAGTPISCVGLRSHAHVGPVVQAN